MIEFEKSPISLTLSDIDISEKACQVTIGTVLIRGGTPPGNKKYWEKLHASFKENFATITV